MVWLWDYNFHELGYGAATPRVWDDNPHWREFLAVKPQTIIRWLEFDYINMIETNNICADFSFKSVVTLHALVVD